MDYPPTPYAEDAPPAPPAPPLQGDHRTEIAIIGAGITGLSAALHLSQAGHAPMVLDAGPLGVGASGRNGGQVNPGLKSDPDDVAATYGERLVQAAWNAPDLVFDLIARHAIPCDARRGGTLRAAVSEADLPGLHRLAAQCEARNLGTELQDSAAIAARTFTPGYRAALLDPRGGQINPLAYTRGLAAAATNASLHANTRVTRLERLPGGWRLHGENFTLTTTQLILATNGYTDALWPRLARSIVPVFSAIIASAPLPAPLRAKILAQGEVLYELGAITTYYRIDAAGRLLMGGRSRSRELRGPDAFPFLARHAARLWPDLAVPWTHGWNGQLAITTDHYPHWHEPAPGLIACLGYNGRGIAMATLLGRELARRTAGLPTAELLLPPMAIHTIPLHRFWKIGVATRIAWSRMADRLGR